MSKKNTELEGLVEILIFFDDEHNDYVVTYPGKSKGYKTFDEALEAGFRAARDFANPRHGIPQMVSVEITPE